MLSAISSKIRVRLLACCAAELGARGLLGGGAGRSVDSVRIDSMSLISSASVARSSVGDGLDEAGSGVAPVGVDDLRLVSGSTFVDGVDDVGGSDPGGGPDGICVAGHAERGTSYPATPEDASDEPSVGAPSTTTGLPTSNDIVTTCGTRRRVIERTPITPSPSCGRAR
jgi:hypothetical protein